MASVTGINIIPASEIQEPEEDTYFVQGPVPGSLIAALVTQAGSRIHSGAHSMFLGQVRADAEGGSRVAAIEYSTYLELAYPVLTEIVHTVKATFALDQIRVLHSIGQVAAGEICFFVMTTAGHREAAMHGCEAAVNKIKSDVPVWGKLLFEDGSADWKTNIPVA